MDQSWFTNMFVLGIPVLEKILRPLLVYLFLIIGLRLAGKRELAQLNPFDLVVLLTLSNTVQNAIIGNDNTLTGGIIGATTLLLVNFLVVRWVHRNRRLEQLIEGDADVLVENGVPLIKRMQREDISMEELEEAARKQGLDLEKEVEKATLEPGGAITFTMKPVEPEEARQQQLQARLDQLQQQLVEIKLALEKRP
jgi:uncharacterized membrane protein YcaP (DUF421 family)